MEAAAPVEPTAESTAVVGFSTTAAEPVEGAWWTTFDDALLTSLISRAAASNLSLKQAAARIRQARALRGIVGAPLWPNVDAAAAYTRQRYSDSGPSATPGQQSDLYQAGFDANWEIDVFGGIRRSIEAAEATISAAEDDRRAVLVSLLGEVGGNYVDYRSLQQRISLTVANVEVQRATLALTRKLFAAGLATELDVTRAESQVATTESSIPLFEQQARQAMHRLGVLLGQPPMALRSELDPIGAIPEGPALVGVGVPSDLLLRRPDIRRSERQLAAATAEIGVAVRDLYPRVFITGLAGLSSVHAGDFFDWGSRVAAIGPSITWPVFDAGRIRANIALQTAQQEELLAAYEGIILQAFQEVEDALVAYAQEQVRRDDLARAVLANQRATDLAQQLYAQGLTDFLSVLDAERSLFLSQDALAQSQRNVALNLVALYKAVGGGWEVEEQVRSYDSLNTSRAKPSAVAAAWLAESGTQERR